MEEKTDDGQNDKKWIVTSVGRALFNAILPDRVPYVNETLGKGALGDLVFQSFRLAGLEETTTFLDELKEFGFTYATRAGVSIGLDDMEIPTEKQEILGEAQEDVNRFTKAYHRGVISFGERYNKVIDAWTHANNDVADAMVGGLKRSREGFNPIYMMFDSGARGSRDQIRQLAGCAGSWRSPEEADGRNRRDHREPDPLELPGRASAYSSTSSRPTGPARDSRTPRSRRPMPAT